MERNRRREIFHIRRRSTFTGEAEGGLVTSDQIDSHTQRPTEHHLNPYMPEAEGTELELWRDIGGES